MNWYQIAISFTRDPWKQSQYLDPKPDAKLASEPLSTYQLGIDKVFLVKQDPGVLLQVCNVDEVCGSLEIRVLGPSVVPQRNLEQVSVNLVVVR